MVLSYGGLVQLGRDTGLKIPQVWVRIPGPLPNGISSIPECFATGANNESAHYGGLSELV